MNGDKRRCGRTCILWLSTMLIFITLFRGAFVTEPKTACQANEKKNHTKHQNKTYFILSEF